MPDKYIKEAKKEEEERFRTLFDSSLDGVYQTDVEGIFVKLNQAGAKMLGHRSPKEVIGRNAVVYWANPEDREIFREELKGKKSLSSYPILAKRANGEEFYMENTCRIIEDSKGNFLGIEGILRDVNERKKGEEALRESEEKYRILVENSSDCICHIDLEGKIMYMNRGGITINELKSHEDACGRDCSFAIKDVYEDIMKDALERAKQGKVTSLEYESVTAKGKDRWWESTIGPIKDSKGNVISIVRISRDKTERKQVEEELKRAYNELKTLDELKKNIITNVGHELRTPITIIIGALELLRDNEDKKTRDMYVKMALSNLRRQDAIIGDLLTASRMEVVLKELELTTVDIAQLVVLLRGEFKSEILENKLKMMVTVEEDLPLARADYNQLRHVFRNIINNSIKFNKAEGEIIIEANKKDGMIEVCVMDTGIGIPKDTQEKIFEPLYQGDASSSRAYGGIGMGLALAKDIIEAHGGSIWCESTVGEGTSIYLTLPTMG